MFLSMKNNRGTGNLINSSPLTAGYICVDELGQHCFRQWLVAFSAPSHYLNQFWFVVNWTLRSNFLWNSNRNTTLFIDENASDNVVCEMADILSRGKWVNQDSSGVIIIHLHCNTTAFSPLLHKCMCVCRRVGFFINIHVIIDQLHRVKMVANDSLYEISVNNLLWIQERSRISDTLRWRHNELDGVSDHQSHDCLLNRLFGRRSKKTSKLRVTGLCAGNSPETGEFPAQMASNAENVSIWWRLHEKSPFGFNAFY